MGWQVAATCHLRKLFIFLCIRGGTYIYVPIFVHTIKIHELLNKIISLKVLEVSLMLGQFLIPARWAWGVLCCWNYLTAGFADVSQLLTALTFIGGDDIEDGTDGSGDSGL